jgi:hypothetical protein
MHLEDFPDNYHAISHIFKNKGELFYFANPDILNGEDRVKVNLFWDKKDKTWYSCICGNYKQESNSGFFITGPFKLHVEAGIKLCGYFGISPPLSKEKCVLDLISMTSPENFMQIKKNSYLKKYSSG